MWGILPLTRQSRTDGHPLTGPNFARGRERAAPPMQSRGCSPPARCAAPPKQSKHRTSPLAGTSSRPSKQSVAATAAQNIFCVWDGMEEIETMAKRRDIFFLMKSESFLEQVWEVHYFFSKICFFPGGTHLHFLEQNWMIRKWYQNGTWDQKGTL